jgi:hypothetical protein
LKQQNTYLDIIKGIVGFGIHYQHEGDGAINGLRHANWTRNKDQQHSTLGFTFSMGFSGVTWMFKKTTHGDYFPTKVEYHAL